VSDVIRNAIKKTYLERARKIPFAGICDDPKMTRAAHLEEALEGWVDVACPRKTGPSDMRV
jgi:hypothetical protein